MLLGWIGPAVTGDWTPSCIRLLTMFSNAHLTLVWTTSKEAAAQWLILTARQLLEYMERLREVARWWRVMNRDHQHIMIMPSLFLAPEDLRSTPWRYILSYVNKMDEIERKTNGGRCLYVLAGCYSKQWSCHLTPDNRGVGIVYHRQS